MKLSACRYLFLGLVLFASCRKSDGGPSETDRLNEDVLKSSRDVYLWHDQIPSNFNSHGYAGPEELMEAIRGFSNEPGFPEPVDHFSFAMKKTEWDQLSAGVTEDFGLNVLFYSEGDLRVRAVEKASPAGKAGVRRGWRIVKIDGNTDITTGNSDFIIDKVYYSSSATITFEKPDGSSVDVPLTAATYNQDPIILDTVYTEGTRKVGYLVFNSFLGNRSIVTTSLTSVFNHFVLQHVTDVIVDLRYNGGGYVSLQQTLANFLVRSSADGSVMMHEEYNDAHADENLTTMFEKLGSLDIQNIFFIVSKNTASASELLINNLLPYMQVKLVGEATYGKPVGFYPIATGDWYIFPVSFRSTNSAGSGNYFNGIPVDWAVPDGLDKDWGDTGETRLASVLGYIDTGSFEYAPQPPGLNSMLDQDIRLSNAQLSKRAFKGAVLDK